jgi:hypothetical protein
MEKDSFFGLISMLKRSNQIKMFNIIKETGGEDFLMVKAYIKNAMVNYIIIKVIYIEAALKMD